LHGGSKLRQRVPKVTITREGDHGTLRGSYFGTQRHGKIKPRVAKKDEVR
jgi:hypothetical protein